MKTTLLLVGILLGTGVVTAQEGYVNFIRQVQQDTGVVWNMPIDPEGNSASPGVMEGKGALFELWTIDQVKAFEHLLDQKLVGAYLPSASIAIKTLDPYPHVPRTRVDQPFTVTYQVSGLLAGADLPEAATKVLMEHHLASYPDGQTSIAPATALSGTPHSSAYIGVNGSATLAFPVTSLTATDPTKANGEEHFAIHALSDGSISQTQLASAHVQVWPVASGSISGVTDGQRIRFHGPPLTITLQDLYPSSYTWLQAYPGEPKLGTGGTVIIGSEVVWDDNKSHSDILSVADYDTVFGKDGVYTIELLTRTPFGTDRLHYVTVNVDRTLQIRAQMSGLDQ